MAALVREVEIAGERFMRMADALLVASKSQPGEWYRIENATCTCKGFQYRGACRHLVAAAQIADVTIERSEELGGWVVKWAGHIHGGVHFDRTAAESHAESLRQAEHWDRDAWLERHGYGAPVPPTPTRGHLHLVEGWR